MFVEMFGWIGSISYAIFIIPQTISVIRKGHAHGLDMTFLILLWLGSVFSTCYALNILNGPLLVNFILNLIASTILLKYKIFA